ncbi:MAG: hypothetical protein RR403_01090, partial [Pseudoflavonifractor sp.]
ATIICYDGRRYELPKLLRWRLQYGSGSPCDSFLVECPWSDAPDGVTADASRFEATEGGKIMFRGLVDECEYRWGKEGGRLLITGRGMAALLLDNEAAAAEYQLATLDDILRDHVSPYGITVGARAGLPAVAGFTVESGSSEWQVLYRFACYHGGISPRFDREGRLLLTPWQAGTRMVVDGYVPVTELLYREKRYGILSEVLVRDKPRRTTQKVVNQDFYNRGGRCRRVLSTPGRSSYEAMRYSGDFQLEQSKKEEKQLMMTVPKPFFSFPGDLLELKRGVITVDGIWRVTEAQTGADEDGYYTRLTMEVQ